MLYPVTQEHFNKVLCIGVNLKTPSDFHKLERRAHKRREAKVLPETPPNEAVCFCNKGIPSRLKIDQTFHRFAFYMYKTKEEV